MPIHWREHLSVGDERIDDDHKQLLSLLNGIEVLVRRCVIKDSIVAFLDELTDYTEIHFLREESMMADTDYPRFAEHQKKHHELVRQLAEIREGIDGAHTQEDLYGRVMHLIEILKAWLVDHITSEDKDFSDHQEAAKRSAAG